MNQRGPIKGEEGFVIPYPLSLQVSHRHVRHTHTGKVKKSANQLYLM